MANPLLNDKSFEKAAGTGTLPPPSAQDRPGALYTGPIADQQMQAGWAAPTTGHPGATTGDAMSVSGTIWATILLFGLLMVAAIFGWNAVDVQTNALGEDELVSFPSWSIIAILAGFGVVLVASFKPKLARVLAPVYAILQGAFVGAISRAFEVSYPGIVISAVGATLAVFLVMLVLYVARVIKVTQKFRSIVIGATMGLALFYLVSIVLSLFGVDVPVINDASGLGIAFSVVAAGLAALNLLLDFDIIERGTQAQAPAYMEWFAALGLLVTIVWLYLELLRLLAKLRQN